MAHPLVCIVPGRSTSIPPRAGANALESASAFGSTFKIYPASTNRWHRTAACDPSPGLRHSLRHRHTVPSVLHAQQSSREEPRRMRVQAPAVESSRLTQGPAWVAFCNLPHDPPDLSSCNSMAITPLSLSDLSYSVGPLPLCSGAHTPAPGIPMPPSLQYHIFIQIPPSQALLFLKLDAPTHFPSPFPALLLSLAFTIELSCVL